MKTSNLVKILVALIGAIALIVAAIINNPPGLSGGDKKTDTPSVTASSQPLARITNLADGDTVAQSITLMGKYNPDLKDDIWIFVRDPDTRYYAQSMDTEHGQSTPKINGNWEIRIGVGVAASAGVFDLVLTTANPEASKFIATALKNKDFGGFPMLPPGVTEVQRLKVIRAASTNPGATTGPIPPLPDAKLDGQIMVAPVGADDKVPLEQIVSGRVSGAADGSYVWVMVFTYYGRWYPQSFDPCHGIHTINNGGQWQAKAIFGDIKDPAKDIDKPFDVVVFITDAQANHFLAANQQEWCTNGFYPGLLTIQLPAGMTEKYHTRVIRK